jgi:hypothetical protein
MGGYLIRLNGDPLNIRANENRDLNHQSETDLDNYKGFDFVFENESPIEKLDNFIKKLDKELFLFE